MKRMILIAMSLVLISGAGLIALSSGVAAQSWQNVSIDFKDSKDKGKFSVRYKTDKASSAKNGCRTTIEVKNESGKSIMDYRIKITFKEGNNQERKGSYLSSGNTVQWVYESCGITGVQISEVKP